MQKPAFIGILVVSAALAAGAALAQAYKWVDEDGVVHYSDRPREGAELVILPESSARRRIPAPAPQAAPADQPAEAAEEEPDDDGYESLTVTSPGPEETLWNIGGTLNVTLNVQPALRRGHRVRVYFDGEPQMVSGTSFQLEEVWRGVHNIQAEVVDRTGVLMIRSEPNRFYVQQTSIQNPQRPAPR